MNTYYLETAIAALLRCPPSPSINLEAFHLITPVSYQIIYDVPSYHSIDPSVSSRQPQQPMSIFWNARRYETNHLGNPVIPAHSGDETKQTTKVTTVSRISSCLPFVSLAQFLNLNALSLWKWIIQCDFIVFRVFSCENTRLCRVIVCVPFLFCRVIMGLNPNLTPPRRAVYFLGYQPKIQILVNLSTDSRSLQ